MFTYRLSRIIRVLPLLLAVALLAVPQGGCSQATQAWQKFEDITAAATGAKVPVDKIVLARNAFNAVEVTATALLRVRTCDGTNGPICRPPAATEPIGEWITKGRAARNSLTQFMKDHPGELGPGGLYDALKAATSNLQSLLAKYQP